LDKRYSQLQVHGLGLPQKLYKIIKNNIYHRDSRLFSYTSDVDGLIVSWNIQSE